MRFTLQKIRNWLVKMNGRRILTPPPSLCSEDSDQSIASTALEQINRRQPPEPPRPPRFPAGILVNTADYDEALKKYAGELEDYEKAVKQFDAEGLAVLERDIDLNPVAPAEFSTDGNSTHMINPFCNYVGGINFTHTAHTERHNVTIDEEGKIHVYSRSNISTYSRNNREYFVEVGPFQFKMTKTKIDSKWGYIIEIELNGFTPFIHPQLDSKERVRIAISGYFEDREPDVEEICFHFLNLRNRVDFDEMFIHKEVSNASIRIISKF